MPQVRAPWPIGPARRGLSRRRGLLTNGVGGNRDERLSVVLVQSWAVRLFFEDEVLGRFCHPHRVPLYLHRGVEVGEMHGRDHYDFFVSGLQELLETRNRTARLQVLGQAAEQLGHDHVLLCYRLKAIRLESRFSAVLGPHSEVRVASTVNCLGQSRAQVGKEPLVEGWVSQAFFERALVEAAA